MGPYEEMGLADLALHAWAEERGLEPSGPLREVYRNDPAEVAPEALETDVLLPGHPPIGPYSGYCGSASVISSQGAFERDEHVRAGRTPGSPSSVVRLTHTVSGMPSKRTVRRAPHVAQNVRSIGADER